MLKFAANLEVLMTDTNQTEEQFKSVLTECRTLFEKKLHDYGASWRILRPSALTDQLFIKAKRIRSLEIKKESRVGDGIRPEFIALINYGIVGLVQLAKGFVDEVDMRPDEALALYDRYAREALELMLKKNHDYDEAWRSMRVSSYTDFILTKIQRIKELEDLHGEAFVSEGIDANYMDIINYAVFGAIRMKEGEAQ
ncbi:PF07659 domain protein [Prevotella sp. MSX73]|nr:PF07659 domain protein [Prevotella sp. MSX73]